MNKQIWASAVLMAGMGMTSCDSTSSTHTPQVYVANSQPAPVRVARLTLSQPDPTNHRSASSATQPKRVTRVARATSPRYIPPASPSFETPKEAPRRRPSVAQPVVLPGERLMVGKGGARSYSVKIGGIERVSLNCGARRTKAGLASWRKARMISTAWWCPVCGLIYGRANG